MAAQPEIVVHLREVEVESHLSDAIEKRCQALSEEFREVHRVEISIAHDGNLDVEVRGHATGKHTDIATHATAPEPGPAVDRVLDRIERQLREHRDKRIFTQRRDAQRHPPKRAQLE